MKVLVVFSLLSIALVWAQTPPACDTYKNCQTCTQGGCGWCAATQQCLVGNEVAPTTGQCLGQNWMWGISACNECDMTKNTYISGCETCIEYPNCCWSDTTGACHSIGFTGGCKQTCSCSVYESCRECNSPEGGRNCKWCEDTNSCVENADKCALSVHTCPCSDHYDCSACQEQENCNWCGDKNTCETSGSGCLVATTCEAYCGGASDCLTCDALPGCGWCTKDNKCVDASFSSCPLRMSCFLTCAELAVCSDCVARSDCGWCDNTNANDGPKCMDSSESKAAGCLIRHSCQQQVLPSKGGGFDAGSFVGGMFLVAGLVVLGAGGFIVYRRRQAHSNYAQVN